MTSFGQDTLGITDLNTTLLAWGPCTTDFCPQDYNLDGEVNVSDVVYVLDQWSKVAPLVFPFEGLNSTVSSSCTSDECVLELASLNGTVLSHALLNASTIVIFFHGQNFSYPLSLTFNGTLSVSALELAFLFIAYELSEASRPSARNVHRDEPGCSVHFSGVYAAIQTCDFTTCCYYHDLCYSIYGCTSASWLDFDSVCNRVCNDVAVKCFIDSANGLHPAKSPNGVCYDSCCDATYFPPDGLCDCTVVSSPCRSVKQIQSGSECTDCTSECQLFRGCDSFSAPLATIADSTPDCTGACISNPSYASISQAPSISPIDRKLLPNSTLKGTCFQGLCGGFGLCECPCDDGINSALSATCKPICSLGSKKK